MSNDYKLSMMIPQGTKKELIREKLLKDLEEFFKEYSVQEIGSGLLITTKI